MKNNKFSLAGIAFVIYSLIVAARGITTLVVNIGYSLSFQQILAISSTSIIFPIIMTVLSIITFFVLKKRKMLFVFLGIYILYYIYGVFQAICRVVIFSDMVDELNMHLEWLMIYEINSVIQLVLYVIAMIILLVGVYNMIFKKKTNMVHIISCILMMIAVLLQAIEYVSQIFVAYYNIGFIAAVVNLGISVIFVVAVYLLGMELNRENKNNAILQE